MIGSALLIFGSGVAAGALLCAVVVLLLLGALTDVVTEAREDGDEDEEVVS